MKGGIGEMAATRYRRGGSYAADMALYARMMAEDNSGQLRTLRANLARALREEVTPRQRQVLLLYYDRGMTMKEIARQLGIDRSTVSRTMLRGEARLRRCLRYGAAALLGREVPVADRHPRRKKRIDKGKAA